MNGLEAIELMKQGKMVKSQEIGRVVIYKIIDGDICYKYKDSKDVAEWENDGWFNFMKCYEEYIEPKPLTGWERVGRGNKYTTITTLSQEKYRDFEGDCDNKVYENANYFSTEEKAEEINFKQTLFRKLQRFSDENGGNEIDWNDLKQDKATIKFSCIHKGLYVSFDSHVKNFGQVYFYSKEVAQQAIELFHDDLIEYFTKF